MKNLVISAFAFVVVTALLSQPAQAQQTTFKPAVTTTPSAVTGTPAKTTVVAPAAVTAATPAPGPTPVHHSGTLASINGTSLTVQATTGPFIVTTDGATTITVKGKAATVADLKEGMTLSLYELSGIATKITATVKVSSVSGSITAVNSGQVTVQQKAGPTSFDTNAQTVTTLKGKPAVVADLKPGMKVSAKTELGIATKITATVPVVSVSGLITAVNSGQITVQQKAGPTTFNTNVGTVVTLKGQPATVADLKVGMKLAVKTELGIATKITATVPVVSVSGLITAINGGQITVQQKSGPTMFNTDAGTAVKGKALTVAELKVGMKVSVKTELGIATKITATIPTVAISGTVTNINGGQITIQAKTGPIVFTVDGTTVVKVNGATATAADLAVGMTLTGSTKLGIATSVKAKSAV